MTQSYKQELVELEQEWISKEEKFTLRIKEIERTHFENEDKLKQKFENEYEKLKRQYESKIHEMREVVYALKKQMHEQETEQKMKMLESGLRTDHWVKEEKERIIEEMQRIKQKLFQQKELEIKQVRERASLDLELYAMELNTRQERELLQIE